MVPAGHRTGLIGLQIQEDLGPAEWLRPLLRRWGSATGPPSIDSFVPPVYESYARILAIAEQGHHLPVAAALVRPLLLATTTVDCWYGIWDGYGDVRLDAPAFETCHRRYWLLRGPLHAAAALARPPDLWWPEDRAWFLGGDTDLRFCFLGAAEDSVLSVLRNEWLRADRARPEDRVDAAGERPFSA